MNLDAVQQAIYTALVAAVSDDYDGIYTKVPQASDSGSTVPFPYLTITIPDATRWDTKTDNGMSVDVDVHAWERDDSDLAIRQRLNGVYGALHRTGTLSIAGVSVVTCLFNSSAFYDDPDGVTRHAVLTFRITYQID